MNIGMLEPKRKTLLSPALSSRCGRRGRRIDWCLFGARRSRRMESLNQRPKGPVESRVYAYPHPALSPGERGRPSAGFEYFGSWVAITGLVVPFVSPGLSYCCSFGTREDKA
jgi:hypothetical protein